MVSFHQYKKYVFAGMFFLMSLQYAFAQGSGSAQMSTISFSPLQQTVTQNSTFDVSLYINTHNQDINTIDLKLLFDPHKLALVQPSSGKSLISSWTEPFSYSNIDGTINISGIVQNGFNAQSGLISTITFKALAPGMTAVTIDPSSEILANDALGTKTQTEFGQGVYTIVQASPLGVKVFSDTHQFESQFYNNKNPVVEWSEDPDADGFSILLDNKPFTVPDNKINATTTSMSYSNLEDGVWYFHIKEERNGVWGATTNFTIRIDTTPPDPFQPTVDIVQNGENTRALVSFATTDFVSGIDHYEVAVINETTSPNISPVFVEAANPYQLAVSPGSSLKIFVRAIDTAGNVRDESISVYVPPLFVSFVTRHSVPLLCIVTLLLLAFILFHFLVGHKVATHIKEVVYLLEHGEEMEEVEKELHDEELKKTSSSDS
jgi:hypothetical protein